MKTSVLAPTIDNLLRYFGALRWLFLDAWKQAWRLILLIVSTQVAAVITTAAAIGILLVYVHRVERGGTLHLFQLPLSTDTGSALMVSGLAIILIATSAVGHVLAESLVQRLAIAYHNNTTRRVLRTAVNGSVDELIQQTGRSCRHPVTVASLVTGTTRMSALALRFLILTLTPSLYVIIGATVLFMMDWSITAALMAIVALYLIPLHFIYRAVSRQQRRSGAQAALANTELRQHAMALQGSRRPMSHERIWGPALLGGGVAPDMRNVFGRMMASAKITSLNNVFFILCIVVLLIARGADVAGGGQTWASLIGYVFIARLAWTGVQKISAIAIHLSRFYAEYRALGVFLDAADRVARQGATMPSASTQELLSPLDVAVFPKNESPRPATEEFVQIGPAAILMAIAACDAPEDELSRVRSALEKATDGRLREFEVIVHRASEMLPEASLMDQALGLTRDESGMVRLREYLSSLGVMEELDRLPHGLNSRMNRAELARLSREAVLALTSAYLIEGRASVIVMPLNALAGLNPSFQDQFVTRLQRHAMVLVAPTTQQMLGTRFQALWPHVKGAIVVQDGEVVLGGSFEWLKHNRERIDTRLKSNGGEPAPAHDGLNVDIADVDLT